MKSSILTGLELRVSPDRILEFAGMGTGAPEPVVRLADEASVIAGSALACAAGIYLLCRFTSDKTKVVLENGAVLQSLGLASTISGSDYACVMVVTAGKMLGVEAEGAFGEGNYTKGLFLDAAGSIAVEDAADLVQKKATESLGEAFGSTGRFSPGYCDWDLKGQRTLFDICEAGEIGVTLNEHFFMSPEKSVSAVFGIGRIDDREFLAGKRKAPCKGCPRRACCMFGS